MLTGLLQSLRVRGVLLAAHALRGIYTARSHGGRPTDSGGFAHGRWSVVALTILAVSTAVGPVQAAIVLGDAPAAVAFTSTANSNFTVSQGASVLVFEVAFRDPAQASIAPATITWGTQTLTLAVDEKNAAFPPGGTAREDAIYRLYDPIPGTHAFGWNAPSALTTFANAFTLAGVDVSTVPLTGVGNSTSTVNSASLSSGTVAANSTAVIGECTGVPVNSIAFGASLGGVASGNVLGPNLWTATDPVGTGNTGSTTAVTLISGLSAGTTTFSSTASSSVGNKSPMVVAVFVPGASANYTWTGATNSSWSGATSDINWSLSGSNCYNYSSTFYSNTFSNVAVTFPDLANSNSNIAITASGIQPGSVTFSNNTTSYAFGGGAISGSASVTLNGAGSVTFSNSNSYTGGTTINAGTLTAGNDAALGSGSLGVAAAGTANFMSGSPSLLGLTGSGNIVLGNATGPVNTNLTLNLAANSAFSGVISQATGAAGGLVKSGSATLALTGANSYSGGTTLLAGELIGSGTSPFGTGGLKLSGGTLGLNASVPGLMQGLLGPGNNWANWTGTPTGGTVTSGFYYANIGQTVQTNGDYAPWYQQSTWVYSGEIYIPGNSNGNKVTFFWNIDDAAQLKIDGSLFQGQTPQWEATVTGVLTPGWHSIEWRGSNNGGPGGATGGNGAPYGGIGFGWDPNGGTAIVAMPNDPGNGSLYQTPGIINLPNAMTVAAESTIDLSNAVGGQVIFPSLTIGDNTLHLTGGSGAVGGTISISGTTSLTGGTAATFDVQNANVLDLGGLIAASGSSGLVKMGAGTLILGNTANAYTGRTTIDAGSLVAVGQSYTSPGPATGALGSGPITLNNATLVLSGSTTATTFDLVSGNPLTLAGSSDAIIAGSSLAGAASGTITLAGSSALPVAAGQTLNLSCTNGWTLTSSPAFAWSNSGTISGGPGSAAVNLAGSAGTVTAASSGTLTVLNAVGSGYFAPAATGTVVLSSTYSGPLVNLAPASGGTLVIANNVTSGTLNVAGGTYVATNSASFGPAALALNGGALGATMALTGSNAIANPWTISAGSAAYFTGGNAVQLSGSTSLAAGTESIHISNPGLSVTLSGLIGGSGALVRASDTAGQSNGTLVINNPGNTFSGGFTLQSYGGNIDVQGASTVSSSGSIVSGPLGTGTITIGSTNNGYINLENSASTAVTLANPVNFYDGCAFTSSAGLTLSGPVTLTGPGQGTSNNGVLDIWLGANSNIAFSGVISGGTKGINLRYDSGAGNLTLSGSNTYSGPTSITMGTLSVAGNVPSGAAGVLGDATSVITIGDANSAGNAAALVTTGAYFIARPITVNATAGPATLGTTANGASTYSGAIIQSSSNSLTLSSPAGGSVLFSGNISGNGSGAVIVPAAANIVFSGSNSYTAATLVNGGNLTLNFTNTAVLNPATNVISPSSALTLNSGTLNINGQPGSATSQTFASLTLSGIAPAINVNPNGSSGVTVNLGTITRVGQATIDLPGNNATFTTSSAALVNGIVGGFATVNGTDWLTAGTPTSSSIYSPDDFSTATNNVDVVSGGTANFTGPSQVNSLRFSSSSASTLTLPDALTLTTGGILVTPNVASGTLAITGGSLTASGGTGNPGNDVVVHQFNTTTPFTIGAAITNSGTLSIGLTKSGPGTLILTGSNTFSGPTTVNAGSLQGSVVNLPTNISVNSGGNVTFLENGATPLTSALVVSGAGTLSKDGSQTLTMTKNIATSALYVLNGTLNLGAAGGQTVNGPVSIAAGATLGMSGGSAGSGLLAQFFTDTVNYDGNPAYTKAIFANPTTMVNYYTGGATTTLTTPTLTTLTSANNNAALHFYGNFQAMAPAWANGNSQALILSGNLDITSSGSYQFGANSDDGSMIWIDGNQVVGNNNFQGLQADSPSNNQATGSVTLTAGLHSILIGFYQGTGGEGLNVNYNYNNTGWNYLPNSMLNALPAYTIGPLSGAGTLNVGGILTESASSGSQFDGVMAGSGIFLKSGSGTLILTGSNNTYSGTVQVVAGTLQLTNPLALQNATLDLEPANAGTLDTSTAGLTSLTLGGLMGSQNLAAPAGPLVVGGNGSTTTYSGNISGATSLTKTGTGILVLTSSGSSVGNTIISNGAIQIASGAVLANDAVTVNSAQGLIFGSGVTAASVSSITGSGDLVLQTLDYAAVTLTVGGNGQNTTFSGALGGSGGLFKTGSGALTLTSTANNFTGALTVNSGVLEVTKLGDHFNGTGPITLGGSGPATLRYIGVNAATGRTINLAGNATLDASETSMNPNNNLYFSGLVNGNGYNLTLSGTSGIGGEIDNTINLSGGSLTKNGSGFWLLDSHPNVIASTIVNAGTLMVDDGSTGSGAIVINGGVLASTPYGSTPVTLGSTIMAGTGANAIQPGGNGSIGVLDVPGMTLDHFSTLAFDVSSTASLDQINDAGNLGFSGSGAAGILVSNGTLGAGTYKLMTFSPTSSISLADFSLAGLIGGGATPGNYQLQLKAGELDLSVGTEAVASFSGLATWISTGGTTWSNSSNWVDGNKVNGVPGTASRKADTATFSGSSSVTAITLDVNPSLAALTFSNSNYMLTGGSLTMSGTSGMATLTVNGGTQTIASAVEISGGSLAVVVSSSGALVLSGNVSDDGSPRALTLQGDGTGQLVLSGTANTYSGGTYVDQGTLIVNNSGAIYAGSALSVGGGASSLFASAVVGGSAEASSLDVLHPEVIAVPEPGTLALLAAGLLVSVGIWQRKRR